MTSLVTLPAEKVQLGTGADGPSFTTGVAALELLGDEEEEDEVNLEMVQMVGWLVLVLDCVDNLGSLPKYVQGFGAVAGSKKTAGLQQFASDI